jgi:hypothetical protein
LRTPCRWPPSGRVDRSGTGHCPLFDRAEARDFADVYTLAQRYTKPLLLARAAEIDGGFDLTIFADMLDTLSRFTDVDIPCEPRRGQHPARILYPMDDRASF